MKRTRASGPCVRAGRPASAHPALVNLNIDMISQEISETELREVDINFPNKNLGKFAPPVSCDDAGLQVVRSNLIKLT